MSDNLKINAPHQPQPESVNSDVTGSSYSINSGAPGEGVRQNNTISVTTADLVPQGVGILESARNAFGSPTTRINEQTTVTDPASGQSMALGVAIRLGLVAHGENGGYRATGRALMEPVTAQPAAIPAGGAARVALENAIPPALMNRVIATVITRGTEAVNFGALGMGAESPALTGQLRQAVHVVQSEADDAITEMGADPEQLYAWANANAKADLRHATLRHIHGGDMSAYVAIVDRFLRTVPPSSDLAKGKGYETFIDPNTKQEMVRIDGMSMSLAAAGRAGLL